MGIVRNTLVLFAIRKANYEGLRVVTQALYRVFFYGTAIGCLLKSFARCPGNGVQLLTGLDICSEELFGNRFNDLCNGARAQEDVPQNSGMNLVAC